MAEPNAAEEVNNGPDHNDLDDEPDDGSRFGDECDDELVSSEDWASHIVKGREHILGLKRKFDRMEKKHKQNMVEKSLSVDAAFIWRRLPNNYQNDKSYIVMALKSPKTPDCLKWENFYSYHMWKRLKWDRDILLERLKSVPGFDEAYANVSFPIPSKLRGDKEFMIEVCKRKSQALSLATKKMKNDFDVVKAAVTHKFHFAPMALEHASPKLRNDKRMARIVLSQEYGIRAFRFLSPKLQKDSSLAILAIKKSGSEYSASNEHLSDLPVHFRDDEDVVLEAAKRRGSNLRYVNDENGLLHDSEIVDAACRQDGAALEFVPSEIQKSFLSDKKDLLMILGNGGGQLLEDAPESFQKKPQYILEAVENGYTSPELGELYVPWPGSRDFFFSLLKASNNIGELYNKLPEDVQNQDDVILAVLQNLTIDDSLVCKLLGKRSFPLTNDNKKVLLDVVRKGCVEFLEMDEMQRYMNDTEFVKAACRIDGECLKYACDDIQADPEAVIQALQSTERPITFATLQNLPRDIFDNGTIFASILGNSSFTNDEKLWVFGRIDGETLRSSKTHLLACVNQGWFNHVYDRHGNVLAMNMNDAEVLIALVRAYKNTKFDGRRYGGHLHNLDLGLSMLLDNPSREKKEILKKAIRTEPRIAFASAIEEFREIFDYMLSAVGSGREALQTCSHKGKDLKTVVEFAAKVRERLGGDGFFEFLHGIASPPPPPADEEPPRKRQRRTRAAAAAKQRPRISSVCYLPLLDCGPETSIALKRKIGEFVGVEFGLRYKLLRAADENLKFWGY